MVSFKFMGDREWLSQHYGYLKKTITILTFYKTITIWLLYKTITIRMLYKTITIRVTQNHYNTDVI